MTIELPRRSFLLGLGSLIAAPAIVRIGSLMPVSAKFIQPIVKGDFTGIAIGDVITFGDIVSTKGKLKQFVVTGNENENRLYFYPILEPT
jgi:hypothetical protein